ncbi:hypothetical protein DFH28DRAFT_878865, partial [Melampsora americana]
IFLLANHLSRFSSANQSKYYLSSNTHLPDRTTMSWTSYFSSDRMQGSGSEKDSEDTPGLWRSLSHLLTWPFSSSCSDESPGSTCYFENRAIPEGFIGARCWCSSSEMQKPVKDTTSTSMDLNKSFEKSQHASSQKSITTIEPSEIAMNYDYTPPGLLNTVGRYLDYDVQEIEAKSGFVKTCLVGEDPGFIQSPHSAPDRDLSHGLPYPFRKTNEPVTDMRDMATFTANSHNRTSSKAHLFALETPQSQSEMIKTLTSGPSTMLKIEINCDRSFENELGEKRFTFISSNRELSSLSIHDVRFKF